MFFLVHIILGDIISKQGVLSPSRQQRLLIDFLLASASRVLFTRNKAYGKQPDYLFSKLSDRLQGIKHMRFYNSIILPKCGKTMSRRMIRLPVHCKK
jgi:hypothetical protein